MGQYSLNNRLVVEAYQKEALKTTVTNAFAMVQQKVALKGLTVLMDAHLIDGTVVPAGSKAYIREEILHTHPSVKNILECDTLGQKFLVIDMSLVEFIAPPTGDAA